MKPSNTSKELGMLLGLHAGDALGATLEFKAPRPRENWLRSIEGGGAFGWRPGQATDDTDLMLCVLEAIESRESLSQDLLKQNFLRWFTNGPLDIGHTTRLGLNLLRRGIPLGECGSKEENSQGNGSLMRCAPLALLSLDPMALESLIGLQASVTHAHPRCVLADKIFISSLQLALQGEDKAAIWKAAVRMAQDDNTLYSAVHDAPKLDWEELPTTGYVAHTLGAAFWGLLNGRDFSSAIIQIVNRGDDADTCGAVAGALCGAYYGVEGIPESWLMCLEEAERVRSALGAIKGVE